MSRNTKIILAVGLAVFVLWIDHRISVIDSRFLQPSFSGFKGLILYEFGGYQEAARAYRAHRQKEFLAGRSSGSPARDAFLRGDVKTAKHVISQSLAKKPNSIPNLLLMGEIELDAKNPDQALNRFSRVLQISSQNREALLWSAHAHTQMDQYGKAIDALKMALSSSAKGKWEEGFLLTLQIIGELAARPSNTRPSCLLAHYFRYLRIFDSSNARLAEVYAKEAIVSQDRPDDAYITLGVISYKERDKDKALASFLKAIDANPKNAEAYRWAYTVYGDRGDTLKEYRMIKSAFTISPSDPTYQSGLSYVLTDKLGDFLEAQKLFTQRLELNPHDVGALDQMGFLARHMGKYEESVTYYQRALLLNPQNLKSLQGLGLSWDRLGRKEEALASYQKAVAIAPWQSEPHFRLAGLLYETRRYHEAIREYELGFNHGGRDIDRRARLCMTYHIVSEFNRAANCFRKVLAKDPQNTLARRMFPEVLNNISIQNSR